MKFSIQEYADMTLSTAAVAKRARVCAATVNKESLRVYGVTWAELKKKQRAAQSERLGNVAVGKMYYFGAVPRNTGSFR